MIFHCAYHLLLFQPWSTFMIFSVMWDYFQSLIFPVGEFMAVFHDEVEIEDFEYDDENDLYHYPCPCGDRFEITKEMLEMGEDVATCPSCSLIVRVIYDPDMFIKMETLTISSTKTLITDPS